MQECGNFGFFDPPSCGILLSSIGPMRKAGQTMKERRPAPSGEADGIIEGRNAVTEALRAGTPIDKIYLARGETDAALGHIASTARSKGVVVVECDRRKLDGMSRTHSHQGVIALAAVRELSLIHI